jgi:hypothetical protein
MTRPRQRLRPGIVDLPFRAETIRVVNRRYLHSTYGMPRYFRPSAAGSGPLPDFRNRDIRRCIYPIAPDDRFELRRHSAAISRPVKNSGSGGLSQRFRRKKLPGRTSRDNRGAWPRRNCKQGRSKSVEFSASRFLDVSRS